jgi:predicted transcriptional regulator
VAARIQLSDLQLAILRVLWDRGEAAVSEVQAALATEREQAVTTVATVLDRLHARGVVGRRTEGRQYVYAPAVAEDEVRRRMVSDLTDRLFAGDPRALVSHLVAEGDIDARELKRLQRLIARREKEDGRGR